MKHYINEKTGSHMAMMEGNVPDGFKKVSDKKYHEFKDAKEAARNEARAEKNKISDAKIRGFKFEEVRVSATKEDQSGLFPVVWQIEQGLIEEANFEFSNGAVLKLNKENASEFARRFAGFRQRFFKVEGQ